MQYVFQDIIGRSLQQNVSAWLGVMVANITSLEMVPPPEQNDFNFLCESTGVSLTYYLVVIGVDFSYRLEGWILSQTIMS